MTIDIEYLRQNASEMREDGGSLYFYIPDEDKWIEVDEPIELLLAAALNIEYSND
jgi:hypothetical protein